MNIVYVDHNDVEIGAAPIGDVYKQGLIARIARIFLKNKRGELLLQKRSDHHVSRPSKWDQAAAGHVDENESYSDTAHRELQEEMGIKGITLKPLIKYYREEKDDPRFVKRRFNMIFTGTYDGKVTIDQDEVSDYRWIDKQSLDEWVRRSPKDFTDGFLEAYRIYLDNI
jgi:isopentenyldiphosphate isomerase